MGGILMGMVEEWLDAAEEAMKTSKKKKGR